MAHSSVTRLRDDSLGRYLDGIFEGLTNPQRTDQRTIDSLFERQAMATLDRYARCGAASCYEMSDNVLFLLGTHPVAMLRAMRADSLDAKNWLRGVADDSFSGSPEARDSREAARRVVLAKLAETRVPGFERERHACESTFHAIRYRMVQ
jgi:hypothetical protein